MNRDKPTKETCRLTVIKLIYTIVIGCFLGALFGVQTASGQVSARRLTMNETIRMAQEQSIASMVNENIFAAAYWQYRSYKAGRLPSLNFSAGLVNFERMISTVPNADGSFSYPYVYRLSNNAGLFLRQNISATGGTLSLSTNLQRNDQFDTRLVTYISRPITLSYTQPLFGYNSFKWDKKIEPHNFEAAKLEYLEMMEDVTIRAVDYFWRLAMARLDHESAVARYENSKRLLRLAGERYKIGAIPRSEVLQMELTNLKDSIAINDTRIQYISQKNILASFIGLREDVDIELEIDRELPGITLDYDTVLAAALNNSSFELNQKIELLRADSTGKSLPRHRCPVQRIFRSRAERRHISQRISRPEGQRSGGIFRPDTYPRLGYGPREGEDGTVERRQDPLPAGTSANRL